MITSVEGIATDLLFDCQIYILQLYELKPTTPFGLQQDPLSTQRKYWQFALQWKITSNGVPQESTHLHTTAQFHKES